MSMMTVSTIQLCYWPVLAIPRKFQPEQPLARFQALCDQMTVRILSAIDLSVRSRYLWGCAISRRCARTRTIQGPSPHHQLCEHTLHHCVTGGLNDFPRLIIPSYSANFAGHTTGVTIQYLDVSKVTKHCLCVLEYIHLFMFRQSRLHHVAVRETTAWRCCSSSHVRLPS